MSRLTRKVRRTVEKVAEKNIIEMVKAVRSEPFRFRLAVAWKIIKGWR